MGSLKRKFGTSSCFKKKYLEKGMTISKSRKENLFHEMYPPPLPKNLLYKGFFAKN